MLKGTDLSSNGHDMPCEVVIKCNQIVTIHKLFTENLKKNEKLAKNLYT